MRCAALLFLCRCSGWPDVCILVCLGGGIEEAHSCEVVRCLAVGQYAKQAEEISSCPDRHVACYIEINR